ncbi:hypothetical protein, partial [Sphingomonas bacterium]|uniref:hypothetical protein n=1 Tax=Sphingomonas bacterium TaxID=1895847 RepID=UPI001C2D3D80
MACQIAVRAQLAISSFQKRLQPPDAVGRARHATAGTSHTQPQGCDLLTRPRLRSAATLVLPNEMSSDAAVSPGRLVRRSVQP